MIRKLQLCINATKHEKTMKELLEKMGVMFQFQKGFLAGGVMYIADFYLPRPYMTVIEIDGDSHSTIEQQRRDAKRNLYWKSRDMKVLRITNVEVETMTAEDLRKMIGPFTVRRGHVI